MCWFVQNHPEWDFAFEVEMVRYRGVSGTLYCYYEAPKGVKTQRPEPVQPEKFSKEAVPYSTRL